MRTTSNIGKYNNLATQLPEDFGKIGTGSGGNTQIDDDCPCYEVETAKELYFRRTPGSQNDIAIEVPYKRVVCEGKQGKKTVKIDCETEVAKILQNAGGI